MAFIKVFNRYKARELHSAGFTYMKEKDSEGNTVYVFSPTPDLLSYIHSHFEMNEYIFDNRLNF